MARRMLNEVRKISDKPLKYAINTHYHWDHTNGNNVFKDAGATIVGREKTKEFMVNRAPRQKGFLASRGFPLGEDPFLPELTFTEDIELDLGSQPLRLLYLGAAETDDATVVHLPAENIAISGDTVMTGSFPIFGQPVMNEGLMDDHSWIATIKAIQQLGPECILPGHGPVAREESIRLLINIEQYFLDEVGARVAQGMQIREVIEDLEPKLPEWIAQIPEVWGTPRYAILRVYRGLVEDDEPGWMQIKPSAIPQADEEKVTKAATGLKEFEDFVAAADEASEGGDAGQEIALLRSATRQFSDDPRCYIALADALLKASRDIPSVLEKGDFFDEARSLGRKALEIDPNFAPAHLFEGQYLIMMAYRNGDDTDAGVNAIKRAESCGLDEHGQAQALFFLGMAERTNGNETGAKAHFQRSLALDSSYAQAALALRA